MSGLERRCYFDHSEVQSSRESRDIDQRQRHSWPWNNHTSTQTDRQTDRETVRERRGK